MSTKQRIIYFVIKLVVFSTLAAFVFAFRDYHVENLKPFIGALMLLYGTEGLLFEILSQRKKFYYAPKVYLALIEFIFGIVLIAAPLPFDHVCVIWATWSIIRESYEIKEIVTDFKTVTPRVLSGVESIIVIVFSVLLILNPMEHHAAIHMGLLVAELILNPLVVLIDEFLISRKAKRKTPTDKAE